MMIEAACTSETPVNFYQVTWRYNPEDGHLHSRRCENLKSYSETIVFLASDDTVGATLMASP
jgi:hypothetical protein